MQHQELTSRIIEGCFEVANELGPGFLESVYQRALLVALDAKGLQVSIEAPLKVYFRGRVVGHFEADLLVEGKVLVELKAVRMLLPEHKAQTINYLKATGIEVGLLVNFGLAHIEIKRLYHPGDVSQSPEGALGR